MRNSGLPLLAHREAVSFKVMSRLMANMVNQGYIADPNVGSVHSRSCAVDLTLIDHAGAQGLYQVRKIRALLFHGLCRLGKIDWASESHQELDRCLSRAITASKNFND